MVRRKNRGRGKIAMVGNVWMKICDSRMKKIVSGWSGIQITQWMNSKTIKIFHIYILTINVLIDESTSDLINRRNASIFGYPAMLKASRITEIDRIQVFWAAKSWKASKALQKVQNISKDTMNVSLLFQQIDNVIFDIELRKSRAAGFCEKRDVVRIWATYPNRSYTLLCTFFALHLGACGKLRLLSENSTYADQIGCGNFLRKHWFVILKVNRSGSTGKFLIELEESAKKRYRNIA